MDRSSENISALVTSSAQHPGVMAAKVVPEMARNPRRVLGAIDQNTFGAGLYPCLVNKGELQRKEAICQKTMPIPVHRPVTRAFAEQVTSKKQYLYSEKKKKPAGLVHNSSVIQDTVNDDADEYEDACDDPVPMFVRHTEAMMDEIDSMEEVEMEDVMEDTVMDIDSNDAKNQLAVVEYVDDIYAFYRKAEDSSIVSSNYMALQFDINEKMRAILIDWLIEVHHKFKLIDETLFLTVNLIDRFLERRTESRKKLQLVGMTAMLLACKYEEVSVPLVEHFVMISDQAYTREDILDMEKLMLNTLQFNMSVPTPYVFLMRCLKAAQESDNKKVELLSFFLIELCLVKYEMLKFCPSLLAASAVYTAMCSIYRSREWSKTSERHSKYSEDQLLECSKLMVSFHQKSGTGKLTGVHRKYNTFKLGYAARFEPAEFLLNFERF